jgi:CheY-like chemotaxis protein
MVTVTGVIGSVVADAVGSAAAIRCGLADGSGQIDLIFLGRASVAGLVPGRGCTVTGRASVYRGLVIWNPRYELDQAGPVSAGPVSAGPPTGTEGRVLVVGDDQALCRIIEVNLTARGYRVSAVPSARAAEVPGGEGPGGDVLNANVPGADVPAGDGPVLIIADLGVAGAGEMDTVTALRTRSRTVPILALSAHGGEEVRRAAAAAGADDFLLKPFAIGALLGRVTAHRKAAGWDGRPPPPGDNGR